MDSRKRMGKDKDGVIFPVAPNPVSYTHLDVYKRQMLRLSLR